MKGHYVQSNIPYTLNNNIDNIFLMQTKENHVQIIATIIFKNLSRSKVIKSFFSDFAIDCFLKYIILRNTLK